MKSRILLLGVALIGLGSCSTMYKSGQTPDDVYYSPAPQMRTASSDEDDNYYNQNGNDEYVNVQTEQDRSAYNSEDNYLRMKVRNRSMWSSLDDYAMYNAMYSPYYGGFGGYGLGYGYNPYFFYSPYSMYAPYGLYSPYSYYGSSWGLGIGWGGLYGGWNSFYNPYYSFYNPYYGGGYYYPGSGKTGVTRPANSYRPRTYNLGSYGTNNNNRINNNTNTPRRVFRSNDNNYVNPGRSSSGTTSPRRSTFSSGNDSRPSRSFDSPRSSSPSPSYTPSSSGSRSSGGGGGSAPSRPGRQ